MQNHPPAFGKWSKFKTDLYTNAINDSAMIKNAIII